MDAVTRGGDGSGEGLLGAGRSGPGGSRSPGRNFAVLPDLRARGACVSRSPGHTRCGGPRSRTSHCVGHRRRRRGARTLRPTRRDARRAAVLPARGRLQSCSERRRLRDRGERGYGHPRQSGPDRGRDPGACDRDLPSLSRPDSRPARSPSRSGPSHRRRLGAYMHAGVSRRASAVACRRDVRARRSPCPRDAGRSCARKARQRSSRWATTSRTS